MVAVSLYLFIVNVDVFIFNFLDLSKLAHYFLGFKEKVLLLFNNMF